MFQVICLLLLVFLQRWPRCQTATATMKNDFALLWKNAHNNYITHYTLYFVVQKVKRIEIFA